MFSARYRYILLLVSFLFLVSVSFAQKKGGAYIEFEKVTHDFGKISESAGPVVYSFEFTNTGDAPLVIFKVEPACGCTTPEWTKEPVLPGKKGFIKAIFDPIGYGGTAYDKTMEVKTSATNSTVVLRIRGQVEVGNKLTDIYPFVIDKLMLKNNTFMFSRMTKNDTQEESIEVYNSGKEPLTLTFDNLPPHLSIKVVPAKIAAPGKAVIICTYNAAKKNELGPVADVVKVKLNGKQPKDNYLYTSATIEEDFSSLSEEELGNAPVVEYDKAFKTFGTVKQGATVEVEYSIKNTGRRDLIIHSAKASDEAATITLPKKTIKSGEVIKLKAALNTQKLEGSKYITISLATNSPTQSLVQLTLSGKIEK